MDGARSRVMEILTKRWRSRLPEGKIPRAMKKLMVKRPEFVAMVERVAERGSLPLPDLDFHPELERRPDGSLVDLMMEELGYDPAEFRCTDCGEEIPRSQGRCAACTHWRKTGARTP